jgi:hypothetical protein
MMIKKLQQVNAQQRVEGIGDRKLTLRTRLLSLLWMKQN